MFVEVGAQFVTRDVEQPFDRRHMVRWYPTPFADGAMIHPETFGECVNTTGFGDCRLDPRIAIWYHFPTVRKPRLPPNIAQLQRGSKSPGHPEPGWFMLRLVRRGPWVPATIRVCHHEPGNPENILDTGPYLVAFIGHQEVDPLDVWRWGRTTNKATYDYLMAEHAWASQYAPADPVANPLEPVDLARQPSLY